MRMPTRGLFEKISLREAKQLVRPQSDPVEDLIAAAENLVRHARWAGYHTKINELRRPLFRIRAVRKRRGFF